MLIGRTASVDIKTVAILIIGIAVLLLLAGWIWYMKRCRNDDDEIFEDMEGQEFEQYCAELLESKGFENVEVTPGSHDYGIDIIADKDGISYAIQCKCYSDTVGIKAIQEAYAGRDYYGSMVGAVMTNQYFSKSAKEFADKLNIILWDGDFVMNLIEDNVLPEKKKSGRLIGNLRKKNTELVVEELDVPDEG
ncbi:MAG: restriction endonuclease [Lachnospiraceae bacterium]|nr:restriction endonuclease [Lachnospiraceae bacterium]